jgi:hypothetical protein
MVKSKCSRFFFGIGILGLILSLAGCRADDGDAAKRGVGAACEISDDCEGDSPAQGQDAMDASPFLECLTEFKAGYCGLTGCESHDDCPAGSLCVVADGGVHYCFLLCVDKVDCNTHRAADSEANCTSSVDFIDGAKTSKVCVPPMGN